MVVLPLERKTPELHVLSKKDLWILRSMHMQGLTRASEFAVLRLSAIA